MKTEIKIYEQELEEYSKTSAVIGNLFMILWIALGAVAVVSRNSCKIIRASLKS